MRKRNRRQSAKKAAMKENRPTPQAVPERQASEFPEAYVLSQGSAHEEEPPIVSALDASDDELVDNEAPPMSFQQVSPDLLGPSTLSEESLSDSDLRDAEVAGTFSNGETNTDHGPDGFAQSWLAIRTKIKALEIAGLPVRATDLDAERDLRRNLINALKDLSL